MDQPAEGNTVPGAVIGRARANLLPLVAGQSVSLFGDYVAFFTLPYFMLSLTGEALDLGLTAFAETLPMVLFGLAAGVLLDRMKRLGRLLVAADLARALAFVLLAFLASEWGPELTVRTSAIAVFVVAFLVGSLSVLFDSGLQTYMTRCLLDSDLITGNARLGLARTIALSVGPLVGGLAVTVSGGFAVAFGLNALTFVVSAVFLVQIRPIRRSAAVAAERFRVALASGLRVLFSEPVLRWGTLGGTMTNLVFQPLEALLVLFVAQEVLHIEAITDVASREGLAVGLFIALQAAIGSIGVAFAGRVARHVSLGTMYIVGLVMLGGGFLAVAMLRSWVAVVPAGVALSGVTWVNVSLMTLRQKLAPADQMGRVISASRTLAWSGLPVGAALGGILAGIFGIIPVYVGGSSAVLLVALLLVRTPLHRERVMARSTP
ncbi:MAG: MFS transporter [Acidimicrobiia bacterium]